ncbi:hypothetical protein T484DRAFT_1831221 [Baffinella frigidus]|nr:hypothetical protein T484DRAFT_1831221 [Cryptophyta sp. CCMP2293]
MASGGKTTDGFRRMPEGLALRPRMQELLAEPGAAGSKSESSSPGFYSTPLTPLRSSADQGRIRRRSRSALSSPSSVEGAAQSPAAEKTFVKDVLCRLPSGSAVTFDHDHSSPTAGASPIRSRSLESTFGSAFPDANTFTPVSSPGGEALRREIAWASPQQPAGPKSLRKPAAAPFRAGTSVLPTGLRKSSLAGIVKLTGCSPLPPVVHQPKVGPNT